MNKDNKKFDPLSETFNTHFQSDNLLAKMEDTVDVDAENVDVISDKTAEIITDYEFSRNSIRETLMRAEDSLTEVMQVARQSAEPRAYEVAFIGVKAIIEGNKNLLGLSEQFKNIINKKEKNSSGVNNNNLFIGSTEALNAMLNKMGVDSGVRTINNNKEND